MRKSSFALMNISQLSQPENAIRTTFNDEQFNDLCDSMSKIGLIQPITVIKKAGTHEVVAGHRRFEAAKTIGMTEIPCMVLTGEDKNPEAVKLHENIIREDVNVVDEGRYLAELADKENLSLLKIANLLHKSEEYVAQRVRICEFDPELIDLMQNGKLKLPAAALLNKIENETLRKQYIRYALDNGATINQIKSWVKDIQAIKDEEEGKNNSEPGQVEYIKPHESLVQCEVCNESMKYTETRLVRLCVPCIDKSGIR